MELMRKNVKFNDKKGRYEASYPHNQLLSQLKENGEEALRMMKLLERRLIKNNLTEEFNQGIDKLLKMGVYKPASEVSGADGLQKSFITLTYTLHKEQTQGVF